MQKKPIEILSCDECKKLLHELMEPSKGNRNQQICSRNFTIAVIMLETGLRVSELTNLIISDIFASNYIKDSLIVRAEIAKYKHERTIPLSESAKSSLKNYYEDFLSEFPKAPQHPLFPSNSLDKSLTNRAIQFIIEKASTRALNRKIHPHILRHTFATKLMRVANIRVVQQLLGHVNLSSTQIYTHPDLQDLKQAIDSASLNSAPTE